MSLFDKLKAAAACDIYRFHTPGHKGELCRYDLTELTDGSFPGDAVAESERRAAAFYGAKHAHLLAGGSSQGVKAAIYSRACNGIADINSHRSVFDGFLLSGHSCTTVGTAGDIHPITVADVEKALTPDIGVVVVTSPTYYGYCADIDGLSALCKSHGIKLVIDGAHGAHFGASEYLPPAFADKCDICNVSVHKTLDALTQSAVLLDNLGGADYARLNEAVDIMGTTSPSYLLYASADHAVTELGESKKAYAELFGAVTRLKARFPFLNNDDFTRLVLDCTAIGLEPVRLDAALISRGVYSEKLDGERIVFILTARNTPSDIDKFGDILGAAITELK